MMVSVDEHANVFAQENTSVRQVGPFVNCNDISEYCKKG